jgi:hypothetical protein
MRRSGHLARGGENRCEDRVLVYVPEANRQLGNLGEGRRIILK